MCILKILHLDSKLVFNEKCQKIIALLGTIKNTALDDWDCCIV